MISHHHRTIFVHVPKAAGQSVEQAFLNDLELDWGRRTPLLLLKNPSRHHGPPRLSHLKATEYVSLKFLTQEIYDNYFKFSIVRNPWSRVVSFYGYMNYPVPFRIFVEQILAKRLFETMRWFVGPQTDYVVDAQGRQCVDMVLRLESLKADFPEVAERATLRSPLPHVNKAGASPASVRARLRWLPLALSDPKGWGARHLRGERDTQAHWRDHYCARTRRLVGELYAEDIERFGYGF